MPGEYHLSIITSDYYWLLLIIITTLEGTSGGHLFPQFPHGRVNFKVRWCCWGSYPAETSCCLVMWLMLLRLNVSVMCFFQSLVKRISFSHILYSWPVFPSRLQVTWQRSFFISLNFFFLMEMTLNALSEKVGEMSKSKKVGCNSTCILEQMSHLLNRHWEDSFSSELFFHSNLWKYFSPWWLPLRVLFIEKVTR